MFPHLAHMVMVLAAAGVPIARLGANGGFVLTTVVPALYFRFQV